MIFCSSARGEWRQCVSCIEFLKSTSKRFYLSGSLYGCYSACTICMSETKVPSKCKFLQLWKWAIFALARNFWLLFVSCLSSLLTLYRSVCCVIVLRALHWLCSFLCCCLYQSVGMHFCVFYLVCLWAAIEYVSASVHLKVFSAMSFELIIYRYQG